MAVPTRINGKVMPPLITESDVRRAVAKALANYVPPPGTGGTSYAPLRIPAGETFTVPQNMQVLYRVPIQVDGVLKIEGELIEI